MTRFIAVLFAFLALAAVSAQAQDGWRQINFEHPSGHVGIKFSVKYPETYVESEFTKPFVIKELSYINPISQYIFYVSIAMLPIGSNFINGILKTTDGAWSNGMLNVFWEDMVKMLDGAKSYSTSYYENNPTCDVKIIQSQLFPYTVYREIESRIVIYKDVLIHLQCGDIMLNKNDSQHASHVQFVCNHFFNSLAFYN